LGLTIGIAICGLIFQYVTYELSCDHFNKNFNSIYRLESNQWALTGTAYAPEIAQQFPEVISSCRVSCKEGLGVTLKVGNDLMKLDNMLYADSGFFNIFSFSFIKGNPAHALDAPNSIVLTESTARKIFGDADPLNKSFVVNSKFTFTVTGIIRDVDGFHLKMNAVASFVSLKALYDKDPDFLKYYDTDFLNTYDNWLYYSYFYLKPNTDPVALASKINTYYEERWRDRKYEFSLRPLKEIYFTALRVDLPQTKANLSMLHLYMAIAMIILVIACINFINLTIARASTRSKEIGVRKVIGANKPNLVIQFLGESVIYALIATDFSFVLMNILQPGFNNLMQRQLGISSVNLIWILSLVLILPLLIGILAGIYPALYLTRFKPIVTLKSEKTRGSRSLFFRRVLIVGQFTVSIALIIATLTVHKQLRFLQKSDLGFSKENIINVSLNTSLQGRRDLYKSLLMSEPGVKGVSFTTQSMDNLSWQQVIEIDNENKGFTYLGIDTEFIPLMGMSMSEGRNFMSDIPSDSGKIILNQVAVSYFGLKEPVTGQMLGTGDRKLEILGIVRDFHFNSLRSPIAPLVMMLAGDALLNANIRVETEDLTGTINHLRKTWYTLSPDFLFEYRFLDKNFEKLYGNEVRLGKSFLYLALLAIFIASIGLLGLSSFIAEQRIKEIGIRKSMGDSTVGIIRLFSTEFVKWVILSGLIAMPVASWLMKSWLDGFAFHVKVDGYILAGSCLIALIIALATVTGQTYRIASQNPVKALRYE